MLHLIPLMGTNWKYVRMIECENNITILSYGTCMVQKLKGRSQAHV